MPEADPDRHSRRLDAGPHYPAAVVAGNVETSQTVTDALYGALRALAASQGTMNNFTFGDDTYQYYETISGAPEPAPTSTARRSSRRI
jgi:5-oxoprolinase (ATP-hydrolysing)